MERQNILTGLVKFHSDKVFIELLKKRNPEIYERAIWRSRALAMAEQFEVDLKRERPKLTPQEWRERKQHWLKLKADDQIALQEARIKAIEEHRDFLNQHDLSDEERQAYEGEFFDEIFQTSGQKQDKKGANEYETIS